MPAPEAQTTATGPGTTRTWTTSILTGRAESKRVFTFQKIHELVRDAGLDLD